MEKQLAHSTRLCVVQGDEGGAECCGVSIVCVASSHVERLVLVKVAKVERVVYKIERCWPVCLVASFDAGYEVDFREQTGRYQLLHQLCVLEIDIDGHRDRASGVNIAHDEASWLNCQHPEMAECLKMSAGILNV